MFDMTINFVLSFSTPYTSQLTQYLALLQSLSNNKNVYQTSALSRELQGF